MLELKILGIITPILIAFVMFIVRNAYMRIKDTNLRIDALDVRMRKGTTELEVRQLLADKLLPLDIRISYVSDDITSMKRSLDKFIDRHTPKGGI